MKTIITIKLPKNPDHDYKKKRSGGCPLEGNKFCSDMTGEHHSVLIENITSTDAAIRKVRLKYGTDIHITRVEVVNE